MNVNALKTLEYEKIQAELKQYAITAKAKQKFDQLQPSINQAAIEAWLLETTEARRIVDITRSIPLASLEGFDGIIGKIGKGMVLTPDELIAVRDLLCLVKRLKKFMQSMQAVAPTVASYASSMFELAELAAEIERCIINGAVDDRATPELSRVRKKVAITADRIKQKLNSILSSSTYAGIIQEALVSQRNGRYVIPVKREYKNSLAGNVLDISASGATLFIEPAAIARLQEELNLLKLEEENEVLRILSGLTEMVAASIQEISINLEAMVHYDFIFAKAKYSKALNCGPVNLNTQNKIWIKGGRHPLLGSKAVPLDFEIGEDYRALVITGPNTGGKTVALKTVGLLTLMVQSGLHAPVDPGSQFALFADILADIGDGQSIEQSLSTFSAHVQNIAAIIECADAHSLVLMDELGAGTEPGEGTGFAIAVLEEVFQKQATIVATTHFSEIKEFAEKNEGFKNGCMEFDLDSLKPLYRLRIGQPGESNALHIALRLGIDRRIIERAHEITYREKKAYSVIETLQREALLAEETVAEHAASVKQMQEVMIDTNRREKSRKADQQRSDFKQGDCVFISSLNRTGIVYEPENSRGEVVVMVMKKKLTVNKKRLTLHIAAKDLYPEDYDLDIVFESKENRKKRKLMHKRHVEGVVIETEGEN